MMMKFDIHPSEKLVGLFNEKPYQGQSPLNANIIFLSSDANYATNITNHLFFDSILEYQQDGIAFWKKHGVHHPFLLDSFPFDKRSGGRPFHNTFSRLGLTKEYAENISFLELLDVPTIGNKSKNKTLFNSLINKKHLQFIDDLILSDKKQLIFISKGVLEDMHLLKSQYKVFEWLDDKKEQKSRININSNEIQVIYHFSSSHANLQLSEIKSTIDIWLNNHNKFS